MLVDSVPFSGGPGFLLASAAMRFALVNKSLWSSVKLLPL
jgi:hypothetical protein